MVTYKGIQYTDEQVNELKEWMSDCSWMDDTSELADYEILKGCDFWLDGGLASFDFTSIYFPVLQPCAFTVVNVANLLNRI